MNTTDIPQPDFTTAILVNQSPQEVYDAILNVRGWWSENIEGDTDRAGAVFLYHYKDVHTCRISVTETIPGKSVRWRVLENNFSFIKEQDEWKDDEMRFDISAEGSRTRMIFTQVGLSIADACFDVCNEAWTGFIGNSLRKLITSGKGEPTPKDQDGVFNEELIRKWGIGKQRNPDDFSFSFSTPHARADVFALLQDIRSWWVGLFDEQIEGSANAVGDEFSFRAGEGAHYSRQRLIELEPGRTLTWLVTDSMLASLQHAGEWTGTRFGFELATQDGMTVVTFTHTGLAPAIECYDRCAGAWTRYLEQLKNRLKAEARATPR